VVGGLVDDGGVTGEPIVPGGFVPVVLPVAVDVVVGGKGTLVHPAIETSNTTQKNQINTLVLKRASFTRGLLFHEYHC